jgi:predicted amidohydrolase
MHACAFSLEIHIVSNAYPARKMGLAVAQMGAVNLADSRAAVVRRLVEMMREAAARRAEFVVFPELALTTFFPRYWMEDAEAVERYFEKSMPNADVQPLFDTARELGIGFYLGYAELAPEGSTPPSWWTAAPESSASTARSTCRATPTTRSARRSSTWRRNSSKSATWASASGKPAT